MKHHKYSTGWVWILMIFSFFDWFLDLAAKKLNIPLPSLASKLIPAPTHCALKKDAKKLADVSIICAD